MDEEANLKKLKDVVLGSDISTLSLGDIDERVQLLQNEIERLRDEHKRKSKSLSDAELFFKS